MKKTLRVVLLAILIFSIYNLVQAQSGQTPTLEEGLQFLEQKGDQATKFIKKFFVYAQVLIGSLLLLRAGSLAYNQWIGKESNSSWIGWSIAAIATILALEFIKRFFIS